MPGLKDFLEGKPFRSALHPAIVHLPIGLFTLGVLLDLGSFVFERPEWQLMRAAAIAYVSGIVTAILAAIPGFVDFTEIRDDHPAKKTAMLHMTLNLVAVALFAIGVGLRWTDLDALRPSGIALLAAMGGWLVLGFSGYVGGSMVYEDGVGVGRHRHGPPLPSRTRVFRAKPGETEIRIGRAAEIREGETARVEIDGTVMVIAHHAGAFHAVQEFCTHRFGPLSEGALVNGQVVCPWHNSKFDLATGKVCAGPAKVDLRAFVVEERNGELWLRVPGKE